MIKPQPNPAQRLEDLIAKVEKAEAAVREGRTVDMRPLDAESISIHKQLKGKPDAALQPVLMRAISALERLTRALEDQVATLKAAKK